VNEERNNIRTGIQRYAIPKMKQTLLEGNGFVKKKRDGGDFPVP
jgi:hypothetical protein